jgi:transposase-like protein
MKDLTQLTIADLWSEVKGEDEIWGDLKFEAQVALKMLIERTLLEKQQIIIGVGWNKRSDDRIDYRNGYYERDLETTLGLIRDIAVPRNRNSKIEHRIFESYKRKRAEVDDLVRDAFLSGISTRRISEVLTPVIGAPISAQTVSNIARSLDHQVKLYHGKPLFDNYRFLFLDGVSVNAKQASGRNKKIILCAYGVNIFGVKELISFMQARSETEEAWFCFINDLYRRGLAGKHLELITHDGSAGLVKAMDAVYPFIPKQRCWVHKLRNIASKLPKHAHDTCLAEAKFIYKKANKKEAVECFRSWENKWAKVYPRATKCLSCDIDSLLSFYDFPENLRSKIRTTNAIERSFREIRRRIRPMSCFENPKSCDRIIFGVISHLNKYWENKPLWKVTQKN